MDDNETRYVTLLQQQLEQEQVKRMQVENQFSQSAPSLDNGATGLVEFQLNIREELDKIHHLLSGHIIKKDSEGNEYWGEPEDDRLKIFSDYGVKRIMNIVEFYINKNTLLSNYDAETIKWKVRDFGIALADLIFQQYEHFFYYPSPEELFAKYERVNRSKNGGISDNELYMKCVQWSSDELKHRIRHYEMTVLSIVDAVHSTYLRALNGEERDSLRKNWHIHENTSQQTMPQVPKKFSMFKPSTWGSR